VDTFVVGGKKADKQQKFLKIDFSCYGPSRRFLLNRNQLLEKDHLKEDKKCMK